MNIVNYMEHWKVLSTMKAEERQKEFKGKEPWSAWAWKLVSAPQYQYVEDVFTGKGALKPHRHTGWLVPKPRSEVCQEKDVHPEERKEMRSERWLDLIRTQQGPPSLLRAMAETREEATVRSQVVTLEWKSMPSLVMENWCFRSRLCFDGDGRRHCSCEVQPW